MILDELVSKADEWLTVRRVFGEPYERDGVTVVPVASVCGAGGGGVGRDDEGQEGQGAGYGLHARPAGVYEISDGSVRWRPAVDVNRAVMAGSVVAVVWLVVKLFRRR